MYVHIYILMCVWVYVYIIGAFIYTVFIYMYARIKLNKATNLNEIWDFKTLSRFDLFPLNILILCNGIFLLYIKGAIWYSPSVEMIFGGNVYFCDGVLTNIFISEEIGMRAIW